MTGPRIAGITGTTTTTATRGRVWAKVALETLKAPRIRGAFGGSDLPLFDQFLLVLKLHTVDHGLVLVPSVALTRQKYVTRLPRPATTVEVLLTD